MAIEQYSAHIQRYDVSITVSALSNSGSIRIENHNSQKMQNNIQLHGTYSETVTTGAAKVMQRRNEKLKKNHFI